MRPINNDIIVNILKKGEHVTFGEILKVSSTLKCDLKVGDKIYFQSDTGMTLLTESDELVYILNTRYVLLAEN